MIQRRMNNSFWVVTVSGASLLMFRGRISVPFLRFSLEIACQLKRIIRNHVPEYEALTNSIFVRFEVFTAVTMKNGVFWVVTPCGLTRATRRNNPEDTILNSIFKRQFYTDKNIFLTIVILYFNI
jgi:hypothetical protein